jgi:hypothetical protein
VRHADDVTCAAKGVIVFRDIVSSSVGPSCYASLRNEIPTLLTLMRRLLSSSAMPVHEELVNSLCGLSLLLVAEHPPFCDAVIPHADVLLSAIERLSPTGSTNHSRSACVGVLFSELAARASDRLYTPTLTLASMVTRVMALLKPLQLIDDAYATVAVGFLHGAAAGNGPHMRTVLLRPYIADCVAVLTTYQSNAEVAQKALLFLRVIAVDGDQPCGQDSLKSAFNLIVKLCTAHADDYSIRLPAFGALSWLVHHELFDTNAQAQRAFELARDTLDTDPDAETTVAAFRVLRTTALYHKLAKKSLQVVRAHQDMVMLYHAIQHPQAREIGALAYGATRNAKHTTGCM